MKGNYSTNFGRIVIDNSVIAKMAGLTAVECFGIVGMAALSKRDGIVKLLKKDNFTRGIQVNLKKDKLSLEFHVIIAYGVNIRALSTNLIESVKYKVEEFSGLKVEKINVLVEGVRNID